MEENAQQEPQADARRKRIVKAVGGVIALLATCFWLLVFVMVVRTGYLSRIGLVTATVFIVSIIAPPFFVWTGRKRLATVSHGVHFGLLGLVLLAGATTYLWPQNDDTWRPYRFDDELAKIEAQQAMPDVENAAFHYASVFAEMDVDDEPDFGAGAALESIPWKGDDHPQVSAWLEAQSGVVASLMEIGRMEKCRWPVQAGLYEPYTVPYKKLRRSTLLLMGTGNRDLGEGRVDNALTRYFCVLRMADYLQQQPSRLDARIGFGVERNALEMVRHILVQSPQSSRGIAQIAEHLPLTTDTWSGQWRRLLEYEKLRYMNLLGRLYEVDGRGHIRFAGRPMISPQDEGEQKQAKRPSRLLSLYWLMNMPLDPHGVRGLADRYFARFEPLVNTEPLPRIERRRQPGLAWDDFRCVCNFYRWWAEASFFREEEYTDHRQQYAQCLSLRRGTWLALGLRRYHDRHGAWPESLDQISEYVPPEAFRDPMTGETFVYRPEADSFALYSTGLNRLDEGGRRGYVKALDKVQDDLWIWPPPAPEPELSDEEIRKQLEEIYGAEFVETYLKDTGSKKQ
ncbi:MAG: hypothetical protein MUC88_10030 [Planctomycetes bacterium]|jgi:hypothetical protein|nr:hypothetical protein [Planctomycetota bacterium]